MGANWKTEWVTCCVYEQNRIKAGGTARPLSQYAIVKSLFTSYINASLHILVIFSVFLLNI